MSTMFPILEPSHRRRGSQFGDTAAVTTLVPSACLGGAVVGALETIASGDAIALAARGAILVGGAAVLLALVELTGAALFSWAARRLAVGGWQRASANAFVGASLATPLCAWLLAAVFSGRRLAEIPGRPILLIAGLAALLGLTFSVTAALSTRLPWPRRRRLVTSHGPLAGAILLGAAPFLLWMDSHVLARRYAWFHLSLEVLTILTAQFGAALAVLDGQWRTRLSNVRRGWLTGGLAILSLLGAGRVASGLWAPGGEHDRARIFSRGGVVATVLDQLRPRRDEPAARTSVELLPSAPPGAGPFAGCDVVLVTVDALRADHLGLHGYRRPTSPRIDALAGRSTVFDRAYSSSPHTSFAIASVMTGRNAFPLARAGLLGGLPTLADGFRAAGYRTTGLFPPAVFFVEGEHFQRLEKRRYGFESVRFESLEETRDAVVRTDQAIETLRRSDGRPLFLWVHYFGPHEPYVGHAAEGFGPKEIDRYDDEIAWVDREIGRLLDHLEQRRRPTIVVLTADHGEEFGDHGGAYHGTSLYDEQIRVPLVIHVPNGGARRVAAPVSTLDLAPTLLGLAAVPWPAPLDGVDRQADVLGASEGRLPRPVFAEVESWKAAMVDRRKLICDVARDFCLLFDVVSDPAEKVNVAPRRPREVSELRRDLERWLRRAPGDGAATTGSDASSLLWAARRWERSSLSALGSVIGAGSGAAVADRRAAARLLATATGPEQRSALEHAWREDADEVVRLWAAIGLIALGDRRPIPGLLEAETIAVGDRELEAHRGLVLDGAGHREAAIPLMIEALPGIVDVNLRCRVLAALGRARDPRATAALIGAYDHIRSRICVSEALGNARDPNTIPFLAARLKDDPYTTVRASVARALGLAGDRAALPALLEVFQRDTEEVVVAAAARALADLGAATSIAGARRLPRPPDAKELWLVTAPGRETPQVRLATASGAPLRAELYTSVARDAHAFALPPAGSGFLWVSRPARFALFR